MTDYKPATIAEWLQLLNLEQSCNCLTQQEYQEIDDVTDITWECCTSLTDGSVKGLCPKTWLRQSHLLPWQQLHHELKYMHPTATAAHNM